MKIRVKRIYEEALPADGCRVLVDRLWPRGIKKESAGLDAWEKELAPSSALRTWYGHRPERWEEFREKYRKELSENPRVESFLGEHKKNETVTLLYASREEKRNQAVVLREFLEKKLDT